MIPRRSKFLPFCKISLILIECYAKLYLDADQNPFVIEKRWGIGLNCSGVRKWRIKGRWENSCAVARTTRTSKGLVNRGSRNAIKTFLLPLVNLSLLPAWRFGTSFCYEALLIRFAFSTPVWSSAAATTLTIEYSVRNKLNPKSGFLIAFIIQNCVKQLNNWNVTWYILYVSYIYFYLNYL